MLEPANGAHGVAEHAGREHPGAVDHDADVLAATLPAAKVDRRGGRWSSIVHVDVPEVPAQAFEVRGRKWRRRPVVHDDDFVVRIADAGLVARREGVERASALPLHVEQDDDDRDEGPRAVHVWTGSAHRNAARWSSRWSRRTSSGTSAFPSGAACLNSVSKKSSGPAAGGNPSDMANRPTSSVKPSASKQMTGNP